MSKKITPQTRQSTDQHQIRRELVGRQDHAREATTPDRGPLTRVTIRQIVAYEIAVARTPIGDDEPPRPSDVGDAEWQAWSAALAILAAARLVAEIDGHDPRLYAAIDGVGDLREVGTLADIQRDLLDGEDA